jgi:hypothetical protein
MFLLLGWRAASNKDAVPAAITKATKTCAPAGRLLHEFVLADMN